MPKNNATAVTLDTSLVEIGVYELLVLKDKINGLRGSQGDKLKAAKNAVANNNVSDDILTSLLAPTVWATPPTFYEVSEYLLSLQEDLKEEWDEAAAEQYNASMGASGQELEVLKNRFNTLAGEVESMVTIFTSLGIEVEAEIPKISNAGRPTGSKNQTGVKVSGAAYYVIDKDTDGKRKYFAKAQNHLSSGPAYHHGKKLLNLPINEEEKAGRYKVPVADLKEAIRKAGQDPDISTSEWEVTLPGGVVGLEIVGK